MADQLQKKVFYHSTKHTEIILNLPPNTRAILDQQNSGTSPNERQVCTINIIQLEEKEIDKKNDDFGDMTSLDFLSYRLHPYLGPVVAKFESLNVVQQYGVFQYAKYLEEVTEEVFDHVANHWEKPEFQNALENIDPNVKLILHFLREKNMLGSTNEWDGCMGGLKNFLKEDCVVVLLESIGALEKEVPLRNQGNTRDRFSFFKFGTIEQDANASLGYSRFIKVRKPTKEEIVLLATMEREALKKSEGDIDDRKRKALRMLV